MQERKIILFKEMQPNLKHNINSKKERRPKDSKIFQNMLIIFICKMK